MISTVVMFQDQNIETVNSTWKAAASFKIIMMTSVTRPCFTTQHQTCKIDFWPKPIFRSQTGLVLRPTVSDHITAPHIRRPTSTRNSRWSHKSSPSRLNTKVWRESWLFVKLSLTRRLRHQLLYYIIISLPLGVDSHGTKTQNILFTVAVRYSVKIFCIVSVCSRNVFISACT